MSGSLERLTVYVNDALDGMLSASADNGGSFTCGEVEQIAELFEIVGRTGDANQFRMFHAQGDDDPEDSHRLCQQCYEAFAEEHDMCGPCLHDAKRSGWEPGTKEE